ncbi:hypothetical protein GGX14DRAFT_396448 [Mycena pura]|uniref:Uncharacterized protein n=1 Tax=Mycena pura TaxID=153505 RepID=A0AAD6Y9Z7_9AGAR|nr:hypothetical protein GGX14DRAFT_396448 [Mycena pura]
MCCVTSSPPVIATTLTPNANLAESSSQTLVGAVLRDVVGGLALEADVAPPTVVKGATTVVVVAADLTTTRSVMLGLRGVREGDDVKANAVQPWSLRDLALSSSVELDDLWFLVVDGVRREGVGQDGVKIDKLVEDDASPEGRREARPERHESKDADRFFGLLGIHFNTVENTLKFLQDEAVEEVVDLAANECPIINLGAFSGHRLVVVIALMFTPARIGTIIAAVGPAVTLGRSSAATRVTPRLTGVGAATARSMTLIEGGIHEGCGATDIGLDNGVEHLDMEFIQDSQNENWRDRQEHCRQVKESSARTARFGVRVMWMDRDDLVGSGLSAGIMGTGTAAWWRPFAGRISVELMLHDI